MGIIVRNPEVLGGTPVFRGTRVPIQTLFDYLEGGETLEDFLEGFPTVTRDAALAALDRIGWAGTNLENRGWRFSGAGGIARPLDGELLASVRVSKGTPTLC
jgi:uncharacterized protein (DUF433 family)